VPKRARAVGIGLALAALATGAVLAQPGALSQARRSTISLAAYVAAFNSESTANQVKLGGGGTPHYLDQADALKHALRQEPGAVVLGTGRGVLKSVRFGYKTVPVWVVALDPPGPHHRPDQFPMRKNINLQYNYDVVVESALSGALIEEAQGWDETLPALPHEKLAS